MDDIKESVAELAYYRQAVFRAADRPDRPGAVTADAVVSDDQPSERMTLAEADAELTAPGQLFEMDDLDVRGVPTRGLEGRPPVAAHRPRPDARLRR